MHCTKILKWHAARPLAGWHDPDGGAANQSCDAWRHGPIPGRSFYEALGWSGAQQPDDEVCFFQSGGIVFGLWTALGGHGAPGVELAHNVRTPEEVGAVLIEAERAGGTIVRPAARAEWGGTSGAFADPDGYVWEVAHNPSWTITEDGSIRI